MFAKVVELGDLRLTSEQDKLQLSICTSAEFQLPDQFSAAVDKDLIRELAVGGLWVTRGAQCLLDLVLYIDGKIVEDSQSFHLIEAIACRLRSAPIWNQMGLLVAVAAKHPSPLDKAHPHVSISINCGSKLEEGGVAPSFDMQIDVQPPESVRCATFTGLRVRCNFSTTQFQAVEPEAISEAIPATSFLLQRGSPGQLGNFEQASQSAVKTPAPNNTKKEPAKSSLRKFTPRTPLSKPATLLDASGKRNKRGTVLPKTPLSRQLVQDNSIIPSKQTPKLQTPIVAQSDAQQTTPESSDIPQKRKKAPAKIQAKRRATVSSPDSFIKKEVDDSTPGLSLIMQTPNAKHIKPLPGPLTPTPVFKVPGKKGSTPQTQQNHALIKTWIEQNASNPYPTKVQMQSLLTETGYSKGYMVNLLGKFRTSFLATVIKIEPDMTPPPERPLAPQPLPCRFKLAINMRLDEDMLLDENEDAPFNIENDDMLLDPIDEFLPWFDYGVSPVLLPLSTARGPDHYKLESLQSNQVARNLAFSLPVPVACQLTETALRFLVGGAQHHRRGIKASPAHPELSLTRLVPSLFDTGFKKLIAQNARHTSTITAAICGTLVKNKQGAGLRKNLFLLAFAAKELDDNPDGDVSRSHPQRKMKMQDVVQKRLWSMMHRKLQNHHRARNLRHTTSDGTKNKPVFEDDEDLFAGLDADYESQDSQASQTTVGDDDHVEEEFKSLLDDQVRCASRYDIDEKDLLHDSIIFDDENEEFEDLFLAGDPDDEGLISYLDELEAERERLETERETEEMLIGDFSDADDLLLAGLSADAEDMLLGDMSKNELTVEEDRKGNVASFLRTRGIVEAPLGVGWR